MRMLATIAALLLGLFGPATAVLAAGTAIRWDQCYGDAGVINRNFACDTNSGTNILVGSFVPLHDVVQMSGIEIVVDLASAGPSLPAWWHFRLAGTCRQSSLAIDFVPPEGSAQCVDWANGLSSGGIGNYVFGPSGSNSARVVAASAVPLVGVGDRPGDQEYFAFRLRIDNAKTTGLGACAGCSVPVCIVMQSINITTPVFANNQKVTTPLNGTDSHYATWQGGAASSPRGSGCPAATPTRTSTWGAVKSLYR